MRRKDPAPQADKKTNKKTLSELGRAPTGSMNPVAIRQPPGTPCLAASRNRAISFSARDRLHILLITLQPFPNVSVRACLQGALVRRNLADTPRGHDNEARTTSAISFRKEVIQPQVPLRLPCYDLVPIAEFIFGAWVLAVPSATSDAPHFRGLTGGVYKAQEHIHRGMLTRDY
jgi:hypothetical protein